MRLKRKAEDQLRLMEHFEERYAGQSEFAEMLIPPPPPPYSPWLDSIFSKSYKSQFYALLWFSILSLRFCKLFFNVLYSSFIFGQLGEGWRFFLSGAFFRIFLPSLSPTKKAVTLKNFFLHKCARRILLFIGLDANIQFTFQMSIMFEWFRFQEIQICRRNMMVHRLCRCTFALCPHFQAFQPRLLCQKRIKKAISASSLALPMYPFIFDRFVVWWRLFCHFTIVAFDSSSTLIVPVRFGEILMYILLNKCLIFMLSQKFLFHAWYSMIILVW